MAVIANKLGLLVRPNDDGVTGYRPATKEQVYLKALKQDDYLEGDKGHDDVTLLHSLTQLTEPNKKLLTVLKLLCVLLLGLMAYLFYMCFYRTLAGATTIDNVGLYICTVLVVLAAYFVSVRCINPIVHDRSGHYVNLRTGETNLNGHAYLKKE